MAHCCSQGIALGGNSLWENSGRIAHGVIPDDVNLLNGFFLRDVMVYSLLLWYLSLWASLDYWAGTIFLEARRGRDKVSVF